MTNAGGGRASALSELEALHRRIDERVRELTLHHRERLACSRGCSGCCIDGLTIHGVEAERIRSAAAELVKHGEPHAAGACAFLDADGACHVYEVRPYVCRTQGLPLRWLEECEPGGRTVELRDICHLNETCVPITTLTTGECWTIGPVEDELAGIERRFSGGRPQRIVLRSLFARDRGA